MALSRWLFSLALAAGALAAPAADHLTSRPQPDAPPDKILKVGDKLTTAAGEQKRVRLPDRSLVFVRQSTTLSVTKDSAVELTAGEVYVETAGGKLAPTVTVKTPKRTLQAHDSRFGVRASDEGTSVVVTTGSVKVDGVEQEIKGGQVLSEKGDKPSRTGRTSHLVEWTRSLRTGANLVPASEYAGGSLVARDPEGQEAKLELRRYHVDVHVEGGFARTTISQVYFNHTQDRLEGTFRFPLPPDASLCRLAMYVDGNLMEGGMAERDHARATFERIVWQQRDPALLEWVDGSTFKMRVFPLEPRQEKVLFLSYVQRLPVLDGRLTYRFPAGHTLNEVGIWSMVVLAVGGAEMGWTSESHSFTPRKDGRNLNLQARATKAKLDRDVTLTFQEKDSQSASFATMTQDGAEYLLVRYRPDLTAMREGQRRDWVILAETSGDREPLIARTQIELIRSLLQNAGRDDTFVVLTGSTKTKALRPKAVRNDLVAIEEVMADLEKAHLVGAFDFGAALETARPLLEAVKSPYLVHVGSGIPAMGERTPAKLLERLPKGTRYVGVGVGRRWDRALMQTLAEKTGGYFTQVNPDEAVSWRGLELASTLDTPRLLDAAVSDPDGKTTFLPFVRMVSQGEEVAAVARVSGAMPKRVLVSGNVDGKPFSRELEVKGATAKAGYLPRAWARLEIDRLLAENASENKKQIIELSKAAYVMTPFTSLIVLESDDQYKQYKIDRGRKDQWALYPAPAKIKVVTEPLEGDDGKGVKPSRRTVAKTVVARGSAQALADGRRAQTLREKQRDQTVRLRNLSLGYSPYEDSPMSGELEAKPDPALVPPAFGLEVASARARTELNDFRESGKDWFRSAGGSGHDAAPDGAVPMNYDSDRIAHANLPIYQRGGLEDAIAPAPTPAAPPVSTPHPAAPRVPALVARDGSDPLLYSRLPYVENDRHFFDLLAYAPGLNTSLADLLAVLDAEARSDPRSKPGKIDAKAKALIDGSRKSTWRTWTVPARGLAPSYKIGFDGAGKYAWERALPGGLKEQVVCDSKAVHHVYAELGLASRRTISRHHEAEFAARVPFVTLSAEDLARGADVSLVDERTVAVVPHGAKDAKKYAKLLMTFTDGRLSERRLVEMPGDKVLRREKYSAKGVVTVLDGDDKQLLTLEGKLSDGNSTLRSVDTSKLIVLDLPYRTPEQTRKALGVKPEVQAGSLTFAQATQLLAAHAARGEASQARAIFDAALANREQRQIGYYVLLASCGVNLDSDNADVLDAHPHEPLAHYLSLHTSPTLRRHASRWAATSNVWGEGILRRLGLGHAYCQRWASGKALGISVNQRRTERGRALEYVQSYKGSDLAWALLGLMQDRAGEEKDADERKTAYLELAKAYELFAGSAYEAQARYERARCEWRGGAKEAARKRFTALYREACKDGLPVVDGDFRDALLEATPGWAELLRETAKELLTKKDRAGVLLLARQCWQLEDRVSSRRLLDQAIDKLPVAGEENLRLYRAAIDLLRTADQRDDADRLVELLLEDKEHAKNPDLWRLAASLASEREKPARGLECREKVLELEFAKPAEVVNLARVREDYGELLGSYSELTRSLATLKLKAPDGFRDRVVRAADRWRAMDREQERACRLCSEVLRSLGERELAFDYLVTPVALRPGESSPWESLASDLVRQGDRDQADQAYRSAFERESTNAQILFDRAENLRKAGRMASARALYKQIAEGDWQPRFTALKQQAKWLLEEER